MASPLAIETNRLQQGKHRLRNVARRQIDLWSVYSENVRQRTMRPSGRIRVYDCMRSVTSGRRDATSYLQLMQRSPK
jgi:hypothetical protein